uniref:Uncharacterized protein n=1 Tax=Chionoecetes opilio bacilliform virus TaxID=1825681 RepID=A0A1Q3DKZ9_9VIRU|nr:hypothetical protein SCV_087 [Chionoecetes opilio bacilliform virus]
MTDYVSNAVANSAAGAAPLPNVITGLQAIRSSAQAIAIHSISERLVPGGPKSQQGSVISAASAYLILPREIQDQSISPIVLNPLTGRYLPDRVNESLNMASVQIKNFKKGLGIDLIPLFIH